MLGRSICLLVFVALRSSSQATGASPTASDVAHARALWKVVASYLTRAAAETPESLYRFKPTPDDRSFGERLDHVAASQDRYCRLALGENPGRARDGTGAKTKPQVLEALRASNELCTGAYAQGDQEAARPAYEGDRRSRLYQLLGNVTHDNEQYAKLVTYLRLNHRVPPSSQPATPKPQR
jgi:hypothetical protein